MSHKIDTRERAFSLYAQGYSFDRIQEILKEEDIKVARRTLINWEKKYEWKIRREKIQKQVQSQIDQKQISELTKLSSILTDLQNDLLNELKDVRLKTKEGGIAALRQLHEMRQRLLGDKRFEEHLDELIQTIFEILATDEVIGPKLKDRQTIILERLEKTLKEKYGIR
ncbi:MAG: hypothetical protein N2748_00940 [candidate division WOR-3 bacterium]|nr:hypothetical protein [candidate division WOR-3 bacterium]